MPSIYFLVFVLLLKFMPLHSLEEEEDKGLPPRNCPRTFHCGKLGWIRFPHTKANHPDCGLLVVDDCEDEGNVPKNQLGGGRWYPLLSIIQDDTTKITVMTISDQELANQLENKDCESLKSFSLSDLPHVSCKCNTALNDSLGKEFNHSLRCKNYTLHYDQPPEMPNDPLSSLCHCPIIPFTNPPPDKYSLFDLLTPNISVEVRVFHECWDCIATGGPCLVEKMQKFNCSHGRPAFPANSKEDKHLRLKLGLGIGLPVALTILIFSIFLVRRQYEQKYASSSNFIRGNTSSNPYTKSDLESSSTIFLGLPIFSYSELVEATDNFDDKNELGDGGFGTVYFGKLRDGREVAIKRLYEHNYRRLEQFINEVEILTRLHHKNLVSLYGCTSRHSRELLLVYEFIPNGTVADHLHGDRMQSGSLTWHIRMRIAIETASALAYLHASDIIHRDVKTNNILVDNNFSVKVADFGLSRLFPNDVTHISTAPQGTPGYVDPEYHQCYQLTEKSDVYSFGVVLTELISSIPAIDITRHRHEINLANLAINKIQKCAFDELIDPNIGYKSDEEVTRMTTSVAEVAFLCLQLDKEMRPSMEEVLEELLRIQSEDHKLDNGQEEHAHNAVPSSVQPPTSPSNGDQISLLKNGRLPPSPISVTDKWVSQSTTPNTSA